MSPPAIAVLPYAIVVRPIPARLRSHPEPALAQEIRFAAAVARAWNRYLMDETPLVGGIVSRATARGAK